ncbi:MAG: NAD-dependent epimerase/dehydratase family protein [Myxococcaceae bacterium]
MSKIFVAGATGFIGQRLILQLLEHGHEVYGLSRIQGAPIAHITHPNLHTVFGELGISTADPELPQDITAAYYLVHSMAQHSGNLKNREQQNAEQFLRWAGKTQCLQLIYLTGIFHENDSLSGHLDSR